jgi:hypothetical protein
MRNGTIIQRVLEKLFFSSHGGTKQDDFKLLITSMKELNLHLIFFSLENADNFTYLSVHYGKKGNKKKKERKIIKTKN